jgi:hypothetical protein
LPPILVGSHIDSVPNGGNFDGDLGSLSALGVLEALSVAGVRTRHPLEMLIWGNEERVAFGNVLAGSRVVAGDVKASRLVSSRESPPSVVTRWWFMVSPIMRVQQPWRIDMMRWWLRRI